MRHGRGTQVVRERSAKPLCVGSIPTRASKLIGYAIRFHRGSAHEEVPLEEVSKLPGHGSIKTTGRSYAKLVKGRQDRLDSLVSATWEK
jgi:hypothetical protein